MRNPKWPGGSLNFEFNETIAVPPGVSIPPSVTKISRPEKHKVMEEETRILLVGH